MRSLFIIIPAIIFSTFGNAQTIGGSAVYNFLKLPNSPQLTALGGVNISNITNDIGLSFNNPALLRPAMNAQLTTVFNSMYAGIKNYHAMIGHDVEALQTTFSAGVQYLDYGSIPQTDASGNILGTFRPQDYVVQFAAAKRYLEKWHYGITAKFIHSSYGVYRSDAIALDVGIAYYDSTNLLQASLVMKNMGGQLRKYQGTTGDDLPFDLQIGITKKAKRMHRFNFL